MKNLVQDLDQAYTKKNNVLLKQNSYYYTVKVSHQSVTTSYQEHKLTCYISIAEMPDSWLFGRGSDGNSVTGLSNIADKMFINFNSEKISEVKQKIIGKYGYSNIEVPPQQIMIYGGQQVNYQLDQQGNHGYVQGTWHPDPENYNGSLRFFFKANLAVKHTNTSYKDETRFDSERYNRDLAKADQDIHSCKIKVENLITEARNQLSSKQSEVELLESDVSATQHKIDSFNQYYKTTFSKNEDFTRELEHQQNKKKLLEQSIVQEKQALEILPDKIIGVKEELEQSKLLLQQKEEQLNIATEKLSESQLKFQAQIESMSAQQRAHVFAEVFGIPEKEFVIDAIDRVGLDSGFLGFRAIVKNNKALLEKALHYKVNLGSCYYEDKSLLQHLILAGNQDLIDFALKLADQDFGSTLFAAISQNDLLTINTILSHNPYLLSSLYEHGYSLLHIAASLGKVDIINTLLSFDKTLVDIQSTNSETPLAVALRRGNSEVIKLLASETNLNYEIDILIKNQNEELLQKLKELKETDIDSKDSEQMTIDNLIHHFEQADLLGQFDDFYI